MKKENEDKQQLLLLIVKENAETFTKCIPPSKDIEEGRIEAFVAGYFKAMKDCGFNVLEEESLESMKIIDEEVQ